MIKIKLILFALIFFLVENAALTVYLLLGASFKGNYTFKNANEFWDVFNNLLLIRLVLVFPIYLGSFFMLGKPPFAAKSLFINGAVAILLSNAILLVVFSASLGHGAHQLLITSAISVALLLVTIKLFTYLKSYSQIINDFGRGSENTNQRK